MLKKIIETAKKANQCVPNIIATINNFLVKQDGFSFVLLKWGVDNYWKLEEETLRKFIQTIEAKQKTISPAEHIVLGTLYQKILKNYPKALDHLQMAADEKNNNTIKGCAFTLLALMHRKGQGIPKNSEKAKYYFEIAAQLNNPLALSCLALFFLSDKKEIETYLDRAAEQGYIISPYIKATIDKNPQKTWRLCEEAIRQGGRNDLLFSLGELYYKGSTTIPKDTNIALKLFELSIHSPLNLVRYSLNRISVIRHRNKLIDATTVGYLEAVAKRDLAAEILVKNLECFTRHIPFEEKELIATAYMALFEIYRLRNNLEKAYQYARGIAKLEETPRDEIEYIKGLHCLDEKNTNRALYFFHRAILTHNVHLRTKAYCEIAKIYIARDEIQTAISNYQYAYQTISRSEDQLPFSISLRYTIINSLEELWRKNKNNTQLLALIANYYQQEASRNLADRELFLQFKLKYLAINEKQQACAPPAEKNSSIANVPKTEYAMYYSNQPTTLTGNEEKNEALAFQIRTFHF